MELTKSVQIQRKILANFHLKSMNDTQVLLFSFFFFFRFIRWKSKSFYTSWGNRCLCQSIKKSGSEISERL